MPEIDFSDAGCWKGKPTAVYIRAAAGKRPSRFAARDSSLPPIEKLDRAGLGDVSPGVDQGRRHPKAGANDRRPVIMCPASYCGEIRPKDIFRCCGCWARGFAGLFEQVLRFFAPGDAILKWPTNSMRLHGIWSGW